MKQSKIRTALSPAEYWEWRTTIQELETHKQKLLNTELQLKLLQKESEIHAVRQQLFQRTRMDAAKNALQQAHSEYERFKGVLEKSLGQSLSNKVIDDITFEIRNVPDENKNPIGDDQKNKE
jgi:hypothetical protein